MTTDHPAVKNRIVNEALAAAIKSNPSPVYTKEAIKKIKTGNFTGQPEGYCRLRLGHRSSGRKARHQTTDIYRSRKIPQTRHPHYLQYLRHSHPPDGRRQERGLQKTFLRNALLQSAPLFTFTGNYSHPYTDPAVTDFLLHYGDLYLGKTTVLCKDTPAFIANRIGVYGIMAIFGLVEKMGLTIDEIDALTGPIIGRPKSATFRTADVVGIDTLVKVAKGVHDNCPEDEARNAFTIPAWLDKMVENKWLGDKTGQGFFKKTKGGGGEKEILVLNLKTMEYEARKKPKFASVEAAKPIDDLKTRLKAVCTGMDKAGDFYRHFHYGLFSYISHRIPEISNEIYRVDDAMMAGFGWEIGAFRKLGCTGCGRHGEKDAGSRLWRSSLGTGNAGPPVLKLSIKWRTAKSSTMM